MIPRACRTCGEPLQEPGGPGCACRAGGSKGGAEAGAGGARRRERPLVRPYVMKAPGPAGGRDGDEGDGTGAPPAPRGGGATPEGPGGVPPRAGGRGGPGATADGQGEGPGAAGTPVSGPGGTPGPGGPFPGTPPGDATAVLPYGPVGAAPEGPADADLGLFADDPDAARGVRDAYDADDLRGPYDPRRRRARLAARRRRRLTLALTVGGVVAALSVGLLGTGLFSGDGDDDRALPKPDTLTAVPTAGGTKPGPDDSRSGAPTDSAESEDTAEPSATASDGSGTGPGDPDGAPTGHTEAGQVTAAPPDSDPDPGPSGPGDPTSGNTPDAPDPPPTLRQGDSGPEVVEMQKRLIEAGFDFLVNTEGNFDYFTTRAVRDFQRDHDVEGDDRGVYGPATRRALEAITKEP